MLADLFSQAEDPLLEPEGRFMRMALDEARRALGRVAPNPAVGAVVVRDGEVVGSGGTAPPPGPHAEIVALRQAGERARAAELYVTLEPCCHHGRTPPCTGAIIEVGIRRVIVATRDPNPEVDGKGLQRLREAGIEVVTGCLEVEAREIIAGFAARLVCGRPRATGKYAMTLDGKIATRTGHSRWISGEAARQIAHILRDRIDAIMVGSNTVVVDNPRLTTRLPDELAGNGGPHHPLRVIVDGRLRTSPDADILARGSGPAPLIYCIEDASTDAERQLTRTGARVVRLPTRNGHVDLPAVMGDLGARHVNEVLIEGGGGLIGALLDVGLVDDLLTFIAPVIVGGDGPPPVAGRGVATMPEAWRLENQRLRRLGDELMLHGRVVYPEAEHV